jgi:tellurite resistance protein
MINPHLNILIQLAKVDGETDPSELELIRQIGTSENIADADIDVIIESTNIVDSIPSLEHFSENEKAELMANLVMVMKIDGKLHKEEMKFCLDVIRKLGYNEDMLFELVSTTYIDPSRDHSSLAELTERARRYIKQ